MKTVYWASVNSTRTGESEYKPTVKGTPYQIGTGIDVSPMAFPDPEILKFAEINGGHELFEVSGLYRTFKKYFCFKSSYGL